MPAVLNKRIYILFSLLLGLRKYFLSYFISVVIQKKNKKNKDMLGCQTLDLMDALTDTHTDIFYHKLNVSDIFYHELNVKFREDT